MEGRNPTASVQKETPRGHKELRFLCFKQVPGTVHKTTCYFKQKKTRCWSAGKKKKNTAQNGHPGYCRENSILKFNHIDPNRVQNSLSEWQRQPGENKLSGRTTMLVPVTRCQQVNADSWLCLQRKCQGNVASLSLSSPGFCLASFTSRVAKYLFIKYLQTNIYTHIFLKKKSFCRLLKSVFVRLFVLPDTVVFSLCTPTSGMSGSVYRIRCFSDPLPPNA